MAKLEIHGWHTQCGDCGYGGGGWRNSPANQGLAILTPESSTCPGCGCGFTGSELAGSAATVASDDVVGMLLSDD